MAHIESGKSSGRRKQVDLNLVPFIDLMSVLITFLLITAVWTQVSMIQIGTTVNGKKNENNPVTPPPMADLVLKVDVKPAGYVLTAGQQVISLPLLSDGQFDEAGLLAQLQRVKQIYPEKQDVILALTGSLPYETLIKAMDMALTAGFPSIDIATGDPL